MARARVHHPLCLEGLEQIIEGVHLEGVAHVVIVGGGENQDDGGIHVMDDAGCLHTCLAGHFHIQEDDLRPQFFHQLDALQAVFGFAHQVEVACLLDHLALDHAHGFVVVSNEYSNLVHLVCSLLILT